MVDRPPARPLPRARRGPRDRPRRSPSAPGATRATSPSGCAARPRAGYVSYDPATGEFSLTDGAGVLPRRPERPEPAGRAASSVLGLPAGRAAHHRGVPHRRGRRLARARRGRLRRVRRVLPARLRRRAGPELDPGARRRRGEADGGRPGGRRRLRARLVVGADRRRRTRAPRSSARTTTPSRSSWRASRPPTRASADRVSFEVATAQTFTRHRLRPGDDVRLPARHGRPGRRGPARARGAGAATAPGCWSSRSPATRWRTTSTRWAGCTTPARCSCACPTRCPSRAATRWARRPGRRRSARWSAEAGFTRFRRAAQTAFNLVYEIRP